MNPITDHAEQPALIWCRRVALVACLAAGCIALLTLAGWGSGHLVLAGKFDDHLPMASSTAILAILFATALFFLAWNPSFVVGRGYGAAVGALLAGWGFIELLESFTGLHLYLEEALFQSSKWGSPNSMSRFTAGTCLLMGCALLLQTCPAGRWGRRAVTLLAFVVVLGQLNVLWDFVECVPESLRILSPLYAGSPVALPNALTWFLLCIGLIAALGPTSFFVRSFLGSSTQSVLLRAFLPLMVLAVLFTSALHSPALNSRVLLTVWTLLTIVVLTLVITKIAGFLGGRIDRAEAERNHALAEMRSACDAAEEANRAKSQFLANMSHELRTPLTVVIGYSEELQEEAQEQNLDDFLPALAQIQAQGKHLLTVINDLLDMSKIEAGKLPIHAESFNLNDMLRDVAKTIRPLVVKEANAFDIHADGDLGTMHADITRLRQCLFNLLSNAGKFTKNGRITLTVTLQQQDGADWICFQVKDTGIGMTPEQLQKMFKPFMQADLSTTRKYGGTGLGLFITRRLCEMMGGEITMESALGQGSTCTIRLPRDARKPEPVAPAKPSLPPELAALSATLKPGRDTILVVDDEQSVRDMIQRILTKDGFQVVACGDGAEALRLAKTIHPRAITLDVMMPAMDGWAVLSALKSDPELADIPVVMITIVDDKNLGCALGAADYLTKPLDRNRLLDILHKQCPPTSKGLALIAEDEPATREMLRRSLEKSGWEVVEAANGQQALQSVQQRQPALILLDLMMPEMDGFEFLAELRQHPQWQTIPVIVITAKDLTEEDRMFLHGSMLLSGSVKKVLQKGKFSRDQLLEYVRELVAHV